VSPPTANPAARTAATGLDGFIAAWDAFFAATRHARGRAAQAQGDALTLSQHHLLSALSDGQELRIGELALAAGVAAPTATRMLDGLERDGIVKRVQSQEDRRAVSVRLTAKGRRLLDAKRELVAAKRRELYESMTPAERAQAEGLLARLAELIEEL
jgi:DNA-binding MarR family transcriptional regulator